LIGHSLSCPERFRIKVIEGLRPVEQFEKSLFFGDLWHLAEETDAKGGDWKAAVLEKARAEAQKFPISADDVRKWYNILLVQFPIALDWWSKHKDNVERQNLIAEESFRVPYTLKASGTTVFLRGKWDRVDLIGKGKNKGIWLTDHKTKGDINPVYLEKQLTFDLQTMFYLVALKTVKERFGGNPIEGFYYNVVRRPLSGGRHSISVHKPSRSNPSGESHEQFYSRLQGLIIEDADYFFYRWKVPVTNGEIEKFEEQFLQPYLENLVQDYEWWKDCFRDGRSSFSVIPPTYHMRGNYHYRLPYGCWNSILEGGMGDVDDYLATGVTAGLQRAETLFPELAG
jgi:hypothetical protein